MEQYIHVIQLLPLILPAKGPTGIRLRCKSL